MDKIWQSKISLENWKWRMSTINRWCPFLYLEYWKNKKNNLSAIISMSKKCKIWIMRYIRFFHFLYFLILGREPKLAILRKCIHTSCPCYFLITWWFHRDIGLFSLFFLPVLWPKKFEEPIIYLCWMWGTGEHNPQQDSNIRKMPYC